MRIATPQHDNHTASNIAQHFLVQAAESLPAQLGEASLEVPRSQYYAQERRQALERDRYTCQYCDRVPKAPTADHVHPRSRGGSDDRHNLACACAYCNGRKGKRTPEEWHAILFQTARFDQRPVQRLFARRVMRNLEKRFEVQPTNLLVKNQRDVTKTRPRLVF
jgi:hypothetical protein